MDTTSMAILGIGFGAASVMLASLGLQGYLLQRRDVYRSLRTVRSIDLPVTDLRKQELSAPLGSRVLAPMLRRIGRGLRRFTPMHTLERLEQMLVYAGEPLAWDAERLLAAKLVLGVSVGLGMLVSAFALQLSLMQTVVFAVLMAGMGYWTPTVIVSNRGRLRQTLIRRALPDSLDLLSITVQAGLAFDAAVERVARETQGPLGEELHRTINEMRLGATRVEALRAFADRTDVPEVKGFVLAMVQADIFGISVAKVLHVQAAEQRTKRRQLAEERAQKVPVKLVFPLVGCIMPSLFVVLMGPGAMQMMDMFSKF